MVSPRYLFVKTRLMNSKTLLYSVDNSDRRIWTKREFKKKCTSYILWLPLKIPYPDRKSDSFISGFGIPFIADNPKSMRRGSPFTTITFPVCKSLCLNDGSLLCKIFNILMSFLRVVFTLAAFGLSLTIHLSNGLPSRYSEYIKSSVLHFSNPYTFAAPLFLRRFVILCSALSESVERFMAITRLHSEFKHPLYTTPYSP
mgnify:CR=1 FL=1